MTRGIRPLRILIVEDEMLLTMDLEAIVASCGHEVVGEAVCLHSAEALRDDTDPDIAFVDVRLARGTNGLDVSEMIQRRWGQSIIIFVTGNPKSIPEDFAGAHGVIAKPFSNAAMTAMIHYLEEGVCAPPPTAIPPQSFVAAPTLIEKWAA